MRAFLRDMAADPLNTGVGCIILLFAVLMLGCASGAGATRSPTPIVQTAVQCIPIRTWTKAEQKQLAATLKPVAESSVLWKLEMDWQRMRDAARACSRP